MRGTSSRGTNSCLRHNRPLMRRRAICQLAPVGLAMPWAVVAARPPAYRPAAVPPWPPHPTPPRVPSNRRQMRMAVPTRTWPVRQKRFGSGPAPGRRHPTQAKPRLQTTRKASLYRWVLGSVLATPWCLRPDGRGSASSICITTRQASRSRYGPAACPGLLSTLGVGPSHEAVPPHGAPPQTGLPPHTTCHPSLLTPVPGRPGQLRPRLPLPTTPPRFHLHRT